MQEAERSPTTLTIHGVAAELEEKLERLSRARGLSLDETVRRILEAAVRSEEPGERRQRLNSYVGWSQDERQDFESSLRAQRQIDESIWR